jgi:hypothetical protein
MSTKQSITRSLVELKTIDGRINKIIDGGLFMTFKTKSKNTRYNEEDFKKSATADFQSVTDLIKRRDQIKNAIVLSNATTMVEIAGAKMTVSQAIEFKNTIAYKAALLATLKQQRQMVIVDVDAHRQKVQNKVDENIRIICGKDAKPDAATLKMVSDGITAGDPVDVYDPLNLDKVIEGMEREIEDFRANVDFVLSESNAITLIDV